MAKNAANGRGNDLSRVIKLHEKVAGRCKEYETSLASLPPLDVLNEHRYALRAIFEILKDVQNGDQDDTKFHHAEERTYHALLCAYNDLVDGVYMDLTDFLADVTKSYLSASMLVLGDRRIEIIEFLNEVGEKIVESRRKSDADERYRIYDEELYDKWFEQLLEYKKFLFGTALPEIAIVHEKKSKEKEETEREKYKLKILMVGSLFIGVIGILTAILF